MATSANAPGERVPPFQQFQTFKFGKVSVPVTEMRLALAQTLVEHKFWGSKGALVEATGREPWGIDATIVFNNTLRPGPAETWEPRQLYPTAFRAFLAEMNDKSTRVLVHPELGSIRVKPRSCNVSWSGAKQNTVEVQASWVETTDLIVKDVPQSSVKFVARELDGHLTNAQLKALAPKRNFQPSFDDTVRSVLAYVDQVQIIQRRTAGKIDHLAYQLNQVTESMAGARNSLTWPVNAATQRLLESLFRLKNEMRTSATQLVIYRVPVITTVASLALSLKVPARTVVLANPSLGRGPTVAAGTQIRYVKSVAA